MCVLVYTIIGWILFYFNVHLVFFFVDALLTHGGHIHDHEQKRYKERKREEVA